MEWIKEKAPKVVEAIANNAVYITYALFGVGAVFLLIEVFVS